MGHGVEGRTSVGAIDEDVARQVAQTMQALATPSRVRILGRLGESACSVGELADDIGMGQSAVSHQLRMLRHLGLVVGERSGRKVVYVLHDAHVADLLAEAVSHVEHVRLGLTDHARRQVS
jgi:ArsR family transcriptional regulator, nickel/cobalt-responsive transcriptional repressor